MTNSSALVTSQRRQNTRAARFLHDRFSVWWLVSLLLFVGLWWLASLLANTAVMTLVPSPVTVFARFFELIVEPFAGLTLQGHVLSSLGRWAIGLSAATVLGSFVGCLFGISPVLRAAFTPVFEFLRYIPPFAWIPLAILWMGVGQLTSGFIVFVAAFPPVVINTQLGYTSVPRRLTMASVNLGAKRLQTLLHVETPVALSTILVGIQIGATNGWMAVIAAEMISGNTGVGFLIIQGQGNADVSTVMAGMIAIGITGALVDAALKAIGRKITHWRSVSHART